jgi:hypothetical protein
LKECGIAPNFVAARMPPSPNYHPNIIKPVISTGAFCSRQGTEGAVEKPAVGLCRRDLVP